MKIKEETLLILSAFFFLFLLSTLFQKPAITGATITQNPTIYDVIIAAGATLDDLAHQFDTQTFNLAFKHGDTIACYTRITANTSTTIKIYKPGDPLTTPHQTFLQDDLECTPLNATITECIALITVNQTALGQWGCLVEANTTQKVAPNPLQMFNTLPAQSRTFPDLLLNLNGSYVTPTKSLLLQDYFRDTDDQELTFIAYGYSFLRPIISADSILTFLNPSSASGEETIWFAAFDGYNTTYSANMSVFIGDETNTTPLQESTCTPVWDCKEWEACENGQQTRTCEDLSACDTSQGKPTTSQSCTVENANLNTDVRREVPLNQLDLGAIDEGSGLSTAQILALSLGVLLLLMGLGLYLWQKKHAQQPQQQPQQPTQTPQQKQPPPQTPTIQATQQPQQPPAQQQTTNITDLQQYVDNALITQGKTAEEITLILTKAGWQTPAIARAISVSNAKRFIQEKQNQGFNKEKIKETLLAKGWDAATFEELYQSLPATAKKGGNI